jgi:hypothetical protein
MKHSFAVVSGIASYLHPRLGEVDDDEARSHLLMETTPNSNSKLK